MIRVGVEEDRGEDGGDVVQVEDTVLLLCVQTTIDTDGRCSVIITARLEIWSHLKTDNSTVIFDNKTLVTLRASDDTRGWR